jgi:hypothetical protein
MKARSIGRIALWSVMVVGSSLLMGSALAHHGRGDTYDTSTELTLKGTVSEVLWRNPHIAILLEVEDENGAIVTWNIEHSNVTTLARQGYNRNSLPPGEEITAVVNPGTGGIPIGLMRYVVRADGTRMFDGGRSGSGLD